MAPVFNFYLYLAMEDTYNEGKGVYTNDLKNGEFDKETSLLYIRLVQLIQLLLFERHLDLM
jgi:hypothetical protein